MLGIINTPPDYVLTITPCSMENHFHPTAARGKAFFIGLTLLFIGSLYLLAYFNLIDMAEDLGSLFSLVILFGTFFFLTYLGIRWAKWVLSIIFLLFSIGFLTEEGPEGKILGVLYGYLGTILHFSSSLKAFFRSQRKESAVSLPDSTLSAELSSKATPAMFPVQETTTIAHHIYPTLLRRIQASFIDSMLVIFAWVLFFSLTDSMGELPLPMTLFALALGFSYEPVISSLSTTLGQRLMGIRVRQFADEEEAISIPKAYLRFSLKALLGWLSYLTIHSNAGRRAIHDLAAGSVMIDTRASKAWAASES